MTTARCSARSAPCTHDNLGVQGTRKVHAELRRKEFDVARRTVERSMKADGLQGIPRLKHVRPLAMR
ncbi:IS3 family transposase [Gordonia sp. ABSL11-1]|uniref:IS3 family transposase n=1 Tax=Gordonia sp. ABSL11-1 TaxID=3053924 RepID=UPI003365A547